MKPSHRRLLIGLLILAGGTCAALPYRRLDGRLDANGHRLRSWQPPSDLVLQQPEASAPSAGPGLVPLAVPQGRPSVRPDGRPDGQDSLSRLPVPPPPPPMAVPRLAPTYEQTLDPSRLLSTPSPDDVSTSAPRSHVLRDGDTLERLAEKYLGDRRRAGELYEANRDRLPSRDLLPLGVEIRLPGPPAVPSATDRAPRGPAPASTGPADGGLAPVPCGT